MAEAATSFLLQNLKDLLEYQLKLSSRAKTELDLLQKELQEMKKDLEKAAEKKSGNDFRDCQNEILEIIYEAEDLIDSYVTQEQVAQSKFVKLNPGKIDLVSQMVELRQNKLEPTFRRARSKLKSLSSSDDSVAKTKGRQVNPLIEKTVVGVEDEIERFVKYLLRNTTGVEAISVVGMPGLGKTTVASKIFRDSRIDHHFPTRIWVNVSEDYKERDIYLTIVKKFTGKDSFTESDSELAMAARKHLSQVKFLLVMDDVWTSQAWNVIKKALPIPEGSGKVLITTRYDIVAAHANPHAAVNRLRFLTPAESWKLLQVEVYGREGVWPKDSKVTGQKISEKCGGLPLAIVVIGGVLLDKVFPEDTREEEWKKVFESAESYLLKDDMVTSLKSIIGLSYYKMPYYLRDCFLYLGVCPKDFEISSWKLIRLWIAEGFIKEEDNSHQSLEDIAEENLKELVRRNLVIVGRKNSRGDVKTCRVHDMIREFCKTEASNFLKVISKSQDTGRFHPELSELPKFRRICVHSRVLDFLNEKLDGPCTRSFICFSKNETDAGENTLLAIAEAFKLLRVFEGSSIRFPKFQPKLTQLIHLRYITLATGEKFKTLPSTISQLWNLQTLVIATSHRTFEIRGDVADMARLRHLKTKAAVVFKRDKSILSKNGKVNRNLQTLNRLSTQNCTEDMLSKTPNIQTLGISGDVASLGNSNCLKNLQCCKRVKIVNVGASETPIHRLLDIHQFPPNLEILSLFATNLDWNYMSILGSLMKLKVLKLKDNAFNGDEWKVNSGEFRNLRFLHVERSGLLSWTIADNTLENLRYLSIYNCLRLLAVPTGLAAESFKILEMGNVSSNAVLSALEIQKMKSKTSEDFSLILAPGTYIPKQD